MSKYRKPFLKRFDEVWTKRFPTWQRGVSLPVFWARADSTYSDVESAARCGLHFYLIVEFTPKWPGRFTGDIIITSSPQGYPQNCNPPHRWRDDIPDLLEGAYRIGHFVSGKDLWWHLIDEEAESKRFWESIPNLPEPISHLKRRSDDWYASSYTVPFTDIASEAIENFCDIFEQHVIPKLNRNG
jgi:hypothetical protein